MKLLTFLKDEIGGLSLSLGLTAFLPSGGGGGGTPEALTDGGISAVALDDGATSAAALEDRS